MDDKAVIADYMERIWNKKELSAIDALLDPAVVIHSLLGSFSGRDQMRQVVKAWWAGFPDLEVTTLQTITQSPLVALQWSANGTHLGEFKGVAATKKKVTYEGITVYRVFDGKIVEYWAYLDMQALFSQLQAQ